jgi:hypothetical protein
MRLNMSDHVNIVIVEMSKLRGMIDALMKWLDRMDVAYAELKSDAKMMVIPMLSENESTERQTRRL